MKTTETPLAGQQGHLGLNESGPSLQKAPGTRSLPSRLTFVPGPGGTSRFMVTEEMPQCLSEAYACVSAGKPQQARQWLREEAVTALAERAAAGACSVETCFLLGLTFFGLKDWEASEQWYRWALDQCPHGMISYELARLCTLTNRFSEALPYLEHAFATLPDHVGTCTSYAAELFRVGRAREGVACLRRATELAPHNALLGSKYLYSLSYLQDIHPEDILAEHQAWARRHAPASRARTRHANEVDADRRLRIGYLSSEFRQHSAAYCFESYLDHRDPDAFEVFGYGDVASPDEVTARLEQKFDHYRSVRQLDDEQAALLIERDQIDILVAVGGHTLGNRLPVLAYKPAPIQVDFGAISTTGMPQVDYRFTDLSLDSDQTQSQYAETSLYFESGFGIYRPPETMPALGPLPCLQNGFVSFACFNNSSKITDEMLRIWAKILLSVERSRLLLKFRGGDDPGTRGVFVDRLGRFGISPERLRIFGWQASGGQYALYSQADIALDTFPFNGCVTSMEAMYMGLPVVTLYGQPDRYWNCHITGALLKRTGLGFFAAGSPQEYHAKAVTLARDPASLETIRNSMRARMNARGGVCDAVSHQRSVESLYRSVWRQWCEHAGPKPRGLSR